MKRNIGRRLEILEKNIGTKETQPIVTNKTVSFLASFPPIQSAIKIGGDGMRIQLDIPETEVPNAVDLLAMRGKVLRVTVEVEKTEASTEYGL